MSFRELDAGEIIRTIERLSERVEARFPGSGLSSVSRDFLGLSRDAAREADALGAPNWMIRVGVGIVIVTMVATAVVALTSAFSAFGQAAESFGAAEMFQTIESLINDIVFLGIAVFFLATIESRIKRRKALQRLQGNRG